MTTKLSKTVAYKVLEVVDAGLVKGVGKPIPGQMCVEAAVCYALGEPHGDAPSCVGVAVREFKIQLNDGPWSSDKARAKGMRGIAIGQLGSDQIDQVEFAKRLALKTVQQIVPIALRAAAKLIPLHAIALKAAAVACEIVKDLSAAESAAYSAASAAESAARSAAESAAESAARSAASAAESAAESAAYSAAESAARSAASAAESAARSAAESAASAARSAAYSAAESAASAAYSAARSAADSVLEKAAEIGLSVLKELGAEGCEWLDIL